MVARAGATRLAPASLPRTMRSPRRSHLRAACCVYSRLFLRTPWPRGKAPSGMLRITHRSPSAAAYPKRDVRSVTILLRPLYVETRRHLMFKCANSCHSSDAANGSNRPCRWPANQVGATATGHDRALSRARRIPLSKVSRRPTDSGNDASLMLFAPGSGDGELAAGLRGSAKPPALGSRKLGASRWE